MTIKSMVVKSHFSFIEPMGPIVKVVTTSMITKSVKLGLMIKSSMATEIIVMSEILSVTPKSVRSEPMAESPILMVKVTEAMSKTVMSSSEIV